MKKFDYKKHLYKTVIIILVIFFVGGVAIGGASILHMDGAYPPYEADPSAFDPPEKPAEAVALLNEAVETAEREMPKTEAKDSCSIDGDVVFSSDNELFGAIARAAKGAVENAYDEAYDASSSDFGEPIDALLGKLKIDPADVKEVECSYIYYVCGNCGESYRERKDVCDKCSLSGTLEERLDDNYTVTLKLDAGSVSFLENYTLRTPAQIEKLLGDNSRGWYVPENTNILYSEPRLVYTVNRINGRLGALHFNAKAALTSHLRFQGAYAQYGETDVTCSLNDDVHYDFTWPSISLADQEPLRPGKTYTIEPKKTEAVQHKRVPDDPTIEVMWESSDKNVFTVDEDGYIKSGKVPGEATLTASFEFGGRTYSDSVTVRVRVPVEQLKFNKYKLELAVGGTFRLQTSTKPKNASVQSVTWYTEDASVATVSPDGTVTAVGTGETTIYALSDDGYYRASCKTVVSG